MILSFALAVGLGGDLSSVHGATLHRAQFTEPVTEVVIYPPQGFYVPRSALPLPAETQTALDREFRDDGTFFGAFAVGKDGSWGWVVGANSRLAAQDIAIAECRRHTDGCVLYAEILPEGFEPLGPGQATMSPEPAEYYNDAGSYPDYRAFALSEDGAYSMVWGYESQPAANAAALSDCSSYVITDLPDLREMPCVLLPLTATASAAPQIAAELSGNPFTGPLTEVVTYPPEGVYVQVGSQQLSPEAQTAHDTEFRAGQFFGAFAVAGDGSWGWVVGANSRLAAQEIAIAECSRHASGCAVFAEVLPRNYQALRPGQATLSPEPAEYFNNPGTRPSYRAFAVSEDGAYSMVWGYQSQQAANAAALSDCQSYRINDLPGLRDMPCQLLPFK